VAGLTLSAAMSVLATACSSSGSSGGGGGGGGSELTISWAEPPDTLNPATTGARDVQPIIINVFDMLTWVTPDGKVTPDLATSWKTENGGKDYTLQLRKGVKFHDGTPFNAASVVANVKYITDKSTQSISALTLLGPCTSASDRDPVPGRDQEVRQGPRGPPRRHGAVLLRQLHAQPVGGAQAQPRLQLGAAGDRQAGSGEALEDHLPHRHQLAGSRQ
jgi:ABC-type transport system substrate-binding protein